MLERLMARKEWKFFAVLPKADAGWRLAWWAALLLRGILPAAFAIAMGVLVGAVSDGHSLVGPLAFVGAIFLAAPGAQPAFTRRSAPTWAIALRLAL